MATHWQNTLAAWQLISVGRFQEALSYAHHDTGLQEIIRLYQWDRTDAGSTAVRGWQAYYRGDYHQALRAFCQAIEEKPIGWLVAWAQLGVAKVATDSGHWPQAVRWCAAAWDLAAELEAIDLLAQISGARGEILLRAGFPLEAAASFADDLALLPPGSRYRGRLRTYAAHAWARMGPHGRTAARVSYLTALHTPGESATKNFAAAGIALLATYEKQAGRAATVPTFPSEIEEQRDLPAYCIAVARARLTSNDRERAHLLQKAAMILPPLYAAEHWWLRGWANSLGLLLPDPPIGLELFPQTIPTPSGAPPTFVADPAASLKFPLAPWWNEFSTENPDEWWAARHHFMP